MSPEKEVSKRQLRREQIRKRSQRQRLTVIGLIVLGTFLIVVPIAYQMLKPAAGVVAIDPGTHPNPNDNSMGAADAPIVIEEFSDFQCPYCKSFHTDTEPLLREHYIDTGKVRFVYRSMGNFVSDNIARAYNRPAKTESRDAALAAYCAGDQNKFWDMHAYLFANNMDVEDGGAFTDKRIKSIAEEAGLDTEAFNSCYDSGTFEERVRQDAADGQAAGVQGTPAFVITYTVNGEKKTRFIEGADKFTKFQQELEAALNEIGAAE
ncbi:MAG TPA: thioredoxin domain-containing protein [Anaerolineales bacterium]|nr:thioredoxin domain-containing protein [Anaerolineales bacterium]